MAVKTVIAANKNPNATVNVVDRNLTDTEKNAIYQATHYGSLGGAALGQDTDFKLEGNKVNSQKTYNTYEKSTGDGTGTGTGSSTSTGTQTTAVTGGGGGYDYASMIASMLAQQRAAAQEAYNNSRGRLEEAWSNTQNALGKNLDSTLNQLRNQYDYASGVANDDAAKSLREAYVNYMLNKKNLNQNLTAAGVSGGATESSLAKLFNNYGTSRNNINTTLAENLAQLLNSYQNNTASAEQLYNSQFADAMNNYVGNLNSLESALANNLMSTYSGSSLSNLASYASTLGNLVNNMSAVPLTATTNNLAVDTYNTSQANDMGTVTDYAKYLAMMQNLASQGASTTQQIQYLKNMGADANTLSKLFVG